MTGFLGEIFGAVQAVKVATAEAGVNDAFQALNEARRKAALRDRLFNEVMLSLYRNAVNLGTGVVLILAGQAMAQGSFTVGDFALFVYYLDSVSDMVTFAGMIVARYKQLDVSLERMGRLMEGAPPEALIEAGPIYMDGTLPDVVYPAKDKRRPPGPARRQRAHLPLPGLGEWHRGRRPAPGAGHADRGHRARRLGQDDAAARPAGPAAHGRGRDPLERRPVEEPDRFFVPPRSAYTAQVPRLFSNTLRNNILLGLAASEDRLRQAIHWAVLESDLAELEQGLETMVGPKGVKLSGGQVQRTAAARMFVREPELLVFDDLSSALDVETERTLWERLFDSAARRAAGIRTPAPRAWWSHTAGPRCAARTRSSCWKVGRSRTPARWTSCWSGARSFAACGMGKRIQQDDVPCLSQLYLLIRRRVKPFGHPLSNHL